MVTRLLQQQVGFWGDLWGVGEASCLVASCTSLILSPQQTPPQTGEQELESLVLKLSVLKDFLSGIQKKVV